MHIALFNVHYSENLGDGLLSLCLSREISKSRYVKVTSCDLAGRTEFGAGSRRRSLAHKLLDAAPRTIGNLGMEVTLGRVVKRQLRPFWAKALVDADCAVLGGGNLLMDVGLNFPLKIAGLSEELARCAKPWAVFGIGASQDWSVRGQQLFKSAFVRHLPLHVSVRDKRSKQVWDSRFSSCGVAKASVCYDPAVLSCDHFPSESPSLLSMDRNLPVLGLNITAPAEIRRNSPGWATSVPDYISWWTELLRHSVKAGYEVRSFTNGSAQDQHFLEVLRKQTGMLDERMKFLPRPSHPEELAALIRNCDVIAGHRMHAHIPAFSYQIPTVGFGWDVKLKSFFEGVGRGEFLVETGSMKPSAVVDCIIHAHASGVSRDTWLSVTCSARRSIVDLIASLEGTLSNSKLAAVNQSQACID